MKSRNSILCALVDVIDFHDSMGIPILKRPEIPDDSRAILRKRLLREECEELIDAIDEADLEHIAKEIADVIFIALGTAIEYGIPMSEVWDEVVRSNMTKTGGEKRADGKILKPAWYEPPALKHLFKESLNGND